MSGDKTDITPEKLAQASAKADATLAASAASPIIPPPATATSLLDAVLVMLGTTIEATQAKVDATDSMYATRQAGAFAESPPQLVAQDQQNAANLTGVATTFPTPVMTSPVPGKVESA